MPKVSTIVAVYNGDATIDRALASIFVQTLADNEIVVVNDGSTDNTAAVLAGYGERIRVVTQPNRGVAAARNAGAHASAGEYLAFLDDDDEWLPEKLSRSVRLLDEDPQCAMAYTRAIKIDRQGRQVGTMDAQASFAESPTMKEMLERPWNVIPSQMLVRHTFYERCGGFDERLKRCEDLLFLLCVREFGHFRRVDEALVRKLVVPMYPKMLRRDPYCDLLIALVRDRFGSSADGFIKGFKRSRVRIMKEMARVLLKEGKRAEARRCRARVIHYEPASPNAYMKYLKTFLPRRNRAPSPQTNDFQPAPPR
jgi:glycosyltransferase involved in cell wall biosynthesis